ncbi:MAG TPA: FtsX-like permease family protein [Candidatus Sulfotelmatobacter sp.]|nr:FtsX-like permease family protein [Candidatus Sulfotelmatobacter sp.]
MRILFNLFRLLSWRAVTRERTRTLVTLCGVALGVAAVLAIRLANEGVLQSFRQSLDDVAGKSRLVVRGGEPGIDERLYPTIAGVPGVEKAVPLIEAVTPVDGQPEMLLILGVDVLSDASVREYRAAGDLPDPLQLLTDPDAILLTDRYAKAHGLRIGDSIRLLTPTGARSFHIRGILSEAGTARFMDGRVGILDIATAQLQLGKLGRLDEVDLLLRPAAQPDQVATDVRRILPSGVTVERPEARNAQVEEMLSAFQLNLFVLSLVALFVGAFLVYNAMSVSVVRQRRQLAILRSLGASRRAVLLVVIGEGALIGLLGTVIGTGLGLLLARGALAAAARTVSALYAFVRPGPVMLPPALLLQAVLLGCGMAVASSLLPALEAASVTPREGMAPASLERHHRPWRISSVGVMLLLTAWGLSRGQPVMGRPLLGYAAAFCLLLGTALLCPVVLLGAQRLLARLLPGSRLLSGWLAARGLGRGLRRNAVTVGAMVVGLAMLVSVSTMVQSFRRTVEVWIGQSIQADLYLSRATRLVRGADTRLPASMADKVRRVPGVAEVDALRRLQLRDARGRPFAVLAGDFDVLARRGGLLFRRGNAQEILRQARAQGAVILSEPFADRAGVREGGTVTLHPPGGPVALRVAGVYYDYTTEGGLVSMDVSLYRRLWHDPWISSLAIYLNPGADPETVRQNLLGRFPRHDLLAMQNRDLKKRVLDVFDQTFTITYALELIALIVATLGILNTLLAAGLERTREIGLLRSVGFRRARVFRMILWEAGWMGGVADVLGILAGLALSLILIYVINKQSFGWTIQFALHGRLLVEYALLTLIASLAAALFPAWRASRLRIAEAVRYE